jgi:hypothetical protein
MNPNLYQFLARDRIAGYHREADQRRLAAEVARRPHHIATARPRASGRVSREAGPT